MDRRRRCISSIRRGAPFRRTLGVNALAHPWASVRSDTLGIDVFGAHVSRREIDSYPNGVLPVGLARVIPTHTVRQSRYHISRTTDASHLDRFRFCGVVPGRLCIALPNSHVKD